MMGKLYQVILICAWLCVTYTQKMGPFKVWINNLESCSPMDGKAWIFEPKIKKYNRTTFAATGPLIVTQDLDDSLKLKVVMAQFTNNGWKKNFFQNTWKNACSTMKSYAPDLFLNCVSSVGLKPKCPIKRGNYTFHDLPLTVNLNNVPTFFYNKYKFNFKVLDVGRTVWCFNAVIDVVPKNKKL